LNVVKETEDIEEEIDEIKIKANRSHNKFIGREALVNDVGVIDYISTEDQAPSNGEN
jgi:low affinity Fe/Cu permease